MLRSEVRRAQDFATLFLSYGTNVIYRNFIRTIVPATLLNMKNICEFKWVLYCNWTPYT